MAQQENNQNNTLAQMFDNNQSLVDLLEQLMPRPLAMFLDDSLRIISFVINICFILTILHWTFGIDIDTRIYKIGVLGLWMNVISCCTIFVLVVLILISKVFWTIYTLIFWTEMCFCLFSYKYVVCCNLRFTQFLFSIFTKYNIYKWSMSLYSMLS